MLRTSIFACVKYLARQFARADRGNVAITFGLALFPIFGFVGAAVDYTRASNARTAMQAALDTAALMVSKDAIGLTQDQLTTKSGDYFAALYNAKDQAPATHFSATFTPTSTGGSTVKLASSGSIQTDFMKIVGIPKIDFSLESSAKWGNKKLRVALALDNTGSMQQDGKMPALQTAAKNLIDQLSALQKKPDDVYISVIPFSKDVNTDPANYSQPWIDWTDWEAEPAALVSPNPKPANWSSYGPKVPCPFNTNGNSYNFNCMKGPQLDGTVDVNATTKIPTNGMICPDIDTSPGNQNSYYNGCYDSHKVEGSDQTFICLAGSSCKCTTVNGLSTGGLTANGHDNGKIGVCTCTGSGSNKTCTQLVATYTHAWKPNNHNTWNGCITDRTMNQDTLNTAPTSLNTYFPAQQFNACPTQATALSSTWTALKDNIDSMNPNGNTNQTIGLAWAWQSISQNQPLAVPAEDVNYAYNKVIILMSDGFNTQNRYTGDASAIDARETILCQNVKDAGITLYMVQVATGSTPDPINIMMKNCASSLDKFYRLTNANDLIATFNTIGTELSKLRLAQ